MRAAEPHSGATADGKLHQNQPLFAFDLVQLEIRNAPFSLLFRRAMIVSAVLVFVGRIQTDAKASDTMSNPALTNHGLHVDRTTSRHFDHLHPSWDAPPRFQQS